MIDTFKDPTFKQFNTEKKEIMEEHIHYNEQDMNNDRELLEIKNFLESDGWSLIPQNQIFYLINLKLSIKMKIKYYFHN